MARTVPDHRLCIWCGREYRESESGDSVFCTDCVALPDFATGDAKISWLKTKFGGVSQAGDDWGQGVNEPWPDTFPMKTRDKLPAPDRPIKKRRRRR
jgi:hypothetical protein